MCTADTSELPEAYISASENVMSTLDEAIAFIDFCEGESTTERPSGKEAATDIGDLLSFEDLDELLKAASPPRTKARVRKASSSSTTLQRKRKAEIEVLRQETRQLEGYLAQLRRQNGRSSRLKHLTAAPALTERDNAVDWHSIAVSEYQERLQSEETNMRLKEVEDRQAKLSNQLRGILQHENAIYGRDFVKKLALPVLVDSCLAVDYSSTVVGQLQNKVECCYQDFGNVFQPQRPPMISSRSELKYDEKMKARILEFTTTTPLESCADAVADTLWDFLANKFAEGPEPNSLQTALDFNLDHRGCVIHFDKFHFLRKFAEKDRVVLVWSDCLLLSSKKLRYCTLGYTVITPLETDPLKECVVHTELKLHMECGGDPTVTKGCNEAHNMALGALSRMMRNFWNTEQNRLLSSVMQSATPLL